MTTNGHTSGLAGAMVTTPTAIAKTLPLEQNRAFEPSDLEQALRLAQLLVKSHLLPRSVQTPEAAFAIIATGRELGLTAMQSLRTIHVIEGKPTLSAELIAALVKNRRDICQWFRLVESSDQIATYETHRVGEPTPTKMSFTFTEAGRAGVTNKDNWKKYPAAMLRARCITALARAVYPDLAMGIYDPDELDREPAAPPQPYVIHEPEAAAQPTAPVPNLTLFADLCDRVDAAESGATLNTIASVTAKAQKAGKLTDQHVEQIREAVTRKRALIGTPPPPSSEPRSDADESQDGES